MGVGAGLAIQRTPPEGWVPQRRLPYPRDPIRVGPPAPFVAGPVCRGATRPRARPGPRGSTSTWPAAGGLWVKFQHWGIQLTPVTLQLGVPGLGQVPPTTAL